MLKRIYCFFLGVMVFFSVFFVPVAAMVPPVAITAASQHPAAGINEREIMRRFAYETAVVPPGVGLGGFGMVAGPPDAVTEISLMNRSDLTDTLADFNAFFGVNVGHCSTVAVTQVYLVGPNYQFFTSILGVLFVSGMTGWGGPPPPPFTVLPPLVPGAIRHPAQLPILLAVSFFSFVPGFFSHSERAISGFLENVTLPAIAGAPAAGGIGVMLHVHNMQRSCCNCYQFLFNAGALPATGQGLANYLRSVPLLNGGAIAPPVPFCGSVVRASLSPGVAAAAYVILPPPAWFAVPIAGGMVAPLVGAVAAAVGVPPNAPGDVEKDDIER
ncbi:MAG: hypothetical protein LBF54_02070 [Holosporaceae bacterium]|jgi:hypothetical protein|nr:hypothetical protein [Holosporaceae bacterium]